MADPAQLPPRLYKYRSMRPPSREFTESIFSKNQVWYAQASTFNDPFDCDHFIDIDRNSAEWREIMERFEERFAAMVARVPGKLIQLGWNAFVDHVNEKSRKARKTRKTKGKSDFKLPKLSDDKLRKIIRRVGEQSEVTFGGHAPADLVDDKTIGAAGLNEMLNEYLEQSKQAIDHRFGVFALAKRANNILMWSHYADEHAGICIEFDTESHPDAFANTHPVAYEQESPVIEKKFANILMNLKDKEPSFDQVFLARIAKEDVDAEWTDKEIRSWFLTKSRLWKYDGEWRSIVPGPGLKNIPAATISGVVIGHKASPETEKAVREWVGRRRRKVTISRAIKVKGKFALDVSPI